MNTLVVFVAVIVMVAAAPKKISQKNVANSGLPAPNQAYYPGKQEYNPGSPGFRGYYPGDVAPVPVAPKIAVGPAYKTVDNKTPAIVRQSQEVSYDGNFSYGYETENGIVAQATGYLKNAGTDDEFLVIEGSYAYVGDDGAPVEVKYYADETGYHAVGNVVPTTPTEIARSLELTDSQPQKPKDSKSN